jgi:hypothetical protein
MANGPFEDAVAVVTGGASGIGSPGYGPRSSSTSTARRRGLSGDGRRRPLRHEGGHHFNWSRKKPTVRGQAR